MKSLCSQTHLMQWLSAIVLLLSILAVEAADKCADVTWEGPLRRDGSDNGDPIVYAPALERRAMLDVDPDNLQPGDVNCRYSADTEASVNYYTCKKLSLYYEITIEQFFILNPGIKKDCSNILPNSEYCVEGFIEPTRAFDGFCGPKHSNATCLGQDVGQCCNAGTGKCGNTTDDCAPGNCYEGACDGDNIYSTDGTCGYQHGYRECVGKWGSCCNMSGNCGNGTQFCGLGSCQSGNCTRLPVTAPVAMGNTTDGTCGGPKSYTCNKLYGTCCNKSGLCGQSAADCGVGCQSKWGQCNTVTSSSTSSKPTTTTSSSTTKSSSAVPTPTPISLDGKCGSSSSTGATCAGSTFGSCCSVKGNCGSTPAFCAVANLCQPKFGTCTPVSTDGKCGSASTTGATCLGSTFGECCSVKGNCGSSAAFCSAGNACQSMFGTCYPKSTDGKCGVASTVSASCSGSSFGDCCSPAGNCGSTAGFCSAGNSCQSAFGTCYPKSLDGKCGVASSVSASCSGSSFGNCCSPAGNCGSTAAFCATGYLCQSTFGTCNPISLDGKCGSASTVSASCPKSAFGNCCSVKGNCGSTDAFCLASNLCQPIFGPCT